ncbi:putative quinol monooxygenase [Polaromonas sp.]|uniref:putative quinol monooxygenase n=1 Tax=Polaromonas sp. TaxID=1869339 RepID=UPI002489FC73|nr:putative quinol monooxygenase [Polaromonas sp.]MDI1342451.1 putative quinol monooxygenase [Polaromonas sp.]
MYIVTVTFQIEPAHMAQFMIAMQANAEESLLRERDCHQFDVCVALDDPTRVFLYEVYTSAAAFQTHLTMPHFKSFNTLSTPWVKSKAVNLYLRD